MGSNITFHALGRPQGKAGARNFYSQKMEEDVSDTPDNIVLKEYLIKGRYINCS